MTGLLIILLHVKQDIWWQRNTLSSLEIFHHHSERFWGNINHFYVMLTTNLRLSIIWCKMVEYVPMVDNIKPLDLDVGVDGQITYPLAALNLYFPGTFDIWAILGANGRQTKLPGCGCYQRAPAWHGLCHVLPRSESATTPYRERSGPREDHSQW